MIIDSGKSEIRTNLKTIEYSQTNKQILESQYKTNKSVCKSTLANYV